MSEKTRTDSILLSNGIKTPVVSLGTYPFKGKDIHQLIETAWELGYRSFDTAWMYDNEIEIGKVLRDLRIDRDEVFITSKFHIDSIYWPRYYYSLPIGGLRFKSVARAYRDSCKRLGLEYLDLYLLHWPFPDYKRLWLSFERLYNEQQVKAIGVCSFLPKHLESLKEVSDLMPHVNQIELNPYNSRLETVHYCQSIGIAIQAYSPFGSGIFTKELLSDPVLIEIASRHEKSAAQIILRWMIQRGILVIPRSMKRSSLTEDIALFDFLLTQEEMDEVDKLNRDRFLEGDSRRVGVDGRYVPR